MSHLKITICCLALIPFAAGCAPRRPQAVEGSSGALVTPKYTAAQLELQVLPAGQDPEYPVASTTDSQAAGLSDAITSDTEISLKNRITLPDMSKGEKQLFFVWGENAFGVPIREAFYEHRAQNDFNEKVGRPLPERAIYQESTHRWFIPIENLFLGHETEIRPLDQQLVRIELLLADNTSVQIDLRFLMTGHLPQAILVVPVPPSDLMPARMHAITSGDWAFSDERYYNPTDRTLKLWLRAVRVNLEELSVLQRSPTPTSVAPTNVLAFFRIPPASYYKSEGPLTFKGMEIRRDEGASETHSLTENEWISAEISPHGTTEVKWLVEARSLVPRCEQLKNQTILVNGGPVQVAVDYGVVGQQVAGFYQRDVRLTESFAPQPTTSLADQYRATLLAAPNPVPAADYWGNLHGISAALFDSKLLPAGLFDSLRPVQAPGDGPIEGPYFCQGVF